MKGIAVRGRKILMMIFRGISVSAVSLILQACYGILPPETIVCEYGMPPIQETTISGKVQTKTGTPIFGIKVSIEGTEYWDYTNKNGDFYLWVPILDDYKVNFKDVDGPYHGGLFQEQTWTIKQNDTYSTMMIRMDLDTETNGE